MNPGTAFLAGAITITTACNSAAIIIASDNEHLTLAWTIMGIGFALTVALFALCYRATR